MVVVGERTVLTLWLGVSGGMVHNCLWEAEFVVGFEDVLLNHSSLPASSNMPVKQFDFMLW